MEGNKMGEFVKEITADEFQILIKTGLVLVDFYADWCAPCRILAPLLETVAQDAQIRGEATIVKLDIDRAQAICVQYGVTSIPTLLLFSNGKKVGQEVGVKDANFLTQWIVSAKQQ